MTQLSGVEQEISRSYLNIGGSHIMICAREEVFIELVMIICVSVFLDLKMFFFRPQDCQI
jgi:hypothetical protein